jgi:hypothetical protein
MLEVLNGERRLQNMANGFTPRPPYRPQTKFESRGLKLGHGVWDLVFRRFGFGWAVLGGFLLTSTKNWVQIRGYHGAALVFLAAAWLFERAGMGFGGHWPGWLFHLSNFLFLGTHRRHAGVVADPPPRDR